MITKTIDGDAVTLTFCGGQQARLVAAAALKQLRLALAHHKAEGRTHGLEPIRVAIRDLEELLD